MNHHHHDEPAILCHQKPSTSTEGHPNLPAAGGLTTPYQRRHVKVGHTGAALMSGTAEAARRPSERRARQIVAEVR